MHRGAVAALVSLMLPLGAGCSAVGSGQECVEADPALVKQIETGARVDFRPILPDGRPGIQVHRVELRDSAVGPLPEKDRKFGAEQLLVFSISTLLGGEDASDGFGSVEALTIFALDADGKLLGPAGEFTTSLFDLESPPDPGWVKWGEELVDTTVANDLFMCVDPD